MHFFSYFLKLYHLPLSLEAKQCFFLRNPKHWNKQYDVTLMILEKNLLNAAHLGMSSHET